MDKQSIISFREKLDRHYAWPSVYTFKFIVPKGKEEELRKLFPMHTLKERASENGNYTSFTTEAMMPSPDSIINVYISASKIEGIISL